MRAGLAFKVAEPWSPVLPGILLKVYTVSTACVYSVLEPLDILPKEVCTGEVVHSATWPHDVMRAQEPGTSSVFWVVRRNYLVARRGMRVGCVNEWMRGLHCGHGVVWHVNVGTIAWMSV